MHTRTPGALPHHAVGVGANLRDCSCVVCHYCRDCLHGGPPATTLPLRCPACVRACMQVTHVAYAFGQIDPSTFKVNFPYGSAE